ncbi:phosphate signaling complex protein PhoU [Brachybacterium huguangmaarense]|uniref:Phosphate-specific transport system accessory protein PhoU n=1 Tax=Brachybacterium huguangmaarense TaxID=1652028 RepID=A0ABY6G4V9_9MICO|nr:phosphate signaling complex protein PhoU [Brachybacterium huguangmaarense]UYG18147.1 phosphate signaling complex protein PhoU [Brachybacterium huguangmaarense]
MREAFHSDLQTIGAHLTRMCTLVESAVADASAALLEVDLSLAERVIAADVHIDELQVDIDERAVDLLARQSPVATDLRVLVSALRMSATLERMGDLGEHIALIARRRHPEPALPEADREDFRRMAELTVAGIRDAQRVIEERDLALAAEVEKRDAEIDDLMQRIYARLDRDGSAYTTAQVTDLTLLGRFYERLGDHAVSLVRRIGFLVTGTTVDPRSSATDVDDI